MKKKNRKLSPFAIRYKNEMEDKDIEEPKKKNRKISPWAIRFKNSRKDKESQKENKPKQIFIKF
jgi:hypothetical protein